MSRPPRKPALQALPIDASLPELVSALAQLSNAVLTAPTGSGKTTRVPPALADAAWIEGRAVVVLEPRRIAARAAAARMAFERGVELGGEVGYRVRFDARVSSRTRIEVVTEGVFLRFLQQDPALERYGAVVFDEFHERNLASDLALAMAARVQRELRPDLRLVVTSATLDPEPLALFLGRAHVARAAGRAHPVELRWMPPPRGADLAESVAAGVRAALAASEGDVLAFLPGVGEIRRARAALAGGRAPSCDVVELYGDLDPSAQDRALQAGARRRVVLATNVAETSVTVAGITAVVDSGLARELRFDAQVGLDRLELARISRASAEQRAGRAGRERPGLCLRLWDERDERSLAPFAEPEIKRVDLAGALLELYAWGEADPRAFGWFERPPEAALARALELLARLGALGPRGRPTALGAHMARLPVHPRLAALLLSARAEGVERRAALAAALLSERDVVPRPAAAQGSAAHAQHSAAAHVEGEVDSDVIDRVRLVEAWAEAGARRGDAALSGAAAELALRAQRQLVRALEELPAAPPQARAHAEDDQALARALLAAYPDRVARRRAPGSERGVLVGGRGVRLAKQSRVRAAELFLAVVLDAGRRGERAEALVLQASEVRREWLAPGLVSTVDELAFDPARAAVVAARRTRYLDLVLDEVALPAPRDAQSAALLAAAAAADLERALALDEPGVARFLARLRSLALWRPELGLAQFDRAELAALLPELAVGALSFAELRAVPLLEILRARLGAQAALLAREAPEALALPSGRSAKLVYEPGKAPVLAARIQEFFGWSETPRVAGGRVPVVLHLLAPNGRPEQITEDLASFWSSAYERVRKELRRRYPKHAWPADPWSARAERRPGDARRS